MSLSNKQAVDKKTGRPLIESVLCYREADPVPQRRLKPKPGTQRVKKFQPKSSYLNQPSAEELRLQSIAEKKQRIAAADAAARAADAAALPQQDDDGTCFVGEVKVRSLGMVTDKINREGLSLEEKSRRSMSKKQEAIDARAAQEALGEDAVPDVLSGQLKKKPPPPPAKVNVSEPPPGTKDIFGKPLPKRPPTTSAPNVTTSSSGPLGGKGETTPGIIHHYDKLLAATTARPGQSVENVKQQMRAYQDPTVGACPGVAGGSGPKRPPPQELPEVDILGQPLRKAVPKGAVGGCADKQPLQLFGGAGGGAADAGGRYLKTAAHRQDMPNYIVNPPTAGPTRQPQTISTLSAPADDEEGEDEAAAPSSSTANNKEISVDFPEKYKRFYAGTCYQIILAACKGWGVRRLRFALKAADSDQDGMISLGELRNAFMKFGAPLEDTDLVKLMALAPAPVKKKGGSAMVLVPNLMEVLRKGPPNPKRRHLISVAYRQALELSKKSSGHMNLDDLECVIDFSAHPTFRPDVRGSMREVMSSFNAHWGQHIQRHTIIHPEMFQAYFEDMGVSYSKDSEFVRMMNGMFHIRQR